MFNCCKNIYDYMMYFTFRIPPDEDETHEQMIKN